MRFIVILPIAYMFLLFTLSSLPDTNVSQNLLTEVPSTLQNLLHIPAFGLLAVLWLFSLKPYAFSNRTVLRLAVILSLAYGGGLELSQSWVPGRFASVGDFLLNCLGVFLFVPLYLKISPYFIHGQALKKSA